MSTWSSDAACANSKIDFFASDSDTKYEARAICQSTCPVRFECLNYALQNQIRFGIWGGVDEYEIRRALSVNRLGEPIARARKPRCPYCAKATLITVHQKRARRLVECTECGLSWWIRRPVKVTTKEE